jgi:hypothetical protein
LIEDLYLGIVAMATKDNRRPKYARRRRSPVQAAKCPDCVESAMQFEQHTVTTSDQRTVLDGISDRIPVKAADVTLIQLHHL